VAGSGEIIGGNLADWPETEQLFRHRADTMESERARTQNKTAGVRRRLVCRHAGAIFGALGM